MRIQSLVNLSNAICWRVVPSNLHFIWIQFGDFRRYCIKLAYSTRGVFCEGGILDGIALYGISYHLQHFRLSCFNRNLTFTSILSISRCSNQFQINFSNLFDYFLYGIWVKCKYISNKLTLVIKIETCFWWLDCCIVHNIAFNPNAFWSCFGFLWKALIELFGFEPIRP